MARTPRDRMQELSAGGLSLEEVLTALNKEFNISVGIEELTAESQGRRYEPPAPPPPPPPPG